MRFKTQPYAHQLREFREHRTSPHRALFWQMRTGKTKTMIDLACYNYFLGTIDAVVVVAPNGVHDNWVRRELPAHAWPDAPLRAAAWSSMRSRDPEYRDELKALMAHDGLAWFTMNEEGFTVKLAKAYVKRFVDRRRVLYITDESQGFGTPGAKRTASARALARKAPMTRILSGTPLDNSPLKAYSQFELVEPRALGFATYSDFCKRYAEYEMVKGRRGKQYPVLREYKNLDELKARMAEYTSVVLREDCEDMPNLVRSTRFYEPSELQMERYLQVLDNTLFELADGTLSTFEGGVRGLKMQQILGGFFVGADGSVEVFEENPRLDALMAELAASLARGKVIVWARFHMEIVQIAERLRRAGVEFVEYHGRVRGSAKAEARERFLADPSVRVFLGQPRAGGKGLNLSSARTVLWYSYSYDAEERKQADERATLIGQGDVDVVDVLASNWLPGRVGKLIDQHILECLDDKSLVAEDLSRSGMQRYLGEMLA